MGALRLQLTPTDIKEIEEGYVRLGVHGARFAPEQLALGDEGTVLGTSSVGKNGKSPLPNK